MNEKQAALLKVTGEVENARTFGYDDLEQVAVDFQIPDFATIDAKRPGRAVMLEGILATVRATDAAKFLGLHSAHDDFHASIPLDDVRARSYVIYGLDGAPLPREKGGPIRFFIPDHAQCNTEEIDECANVKYVDHIELTRERGFDNRPTDDEEHAKLHEHE